MIKFKKSVDDKWKEDVIGQWIQHFALCYKIEHLLEAPYLNWRAI